MRALAVVSLLAAVPVLAEGAERTGYASARGPRVEVAFVLDTTGSMGGLIEGAKRRIWTIARRIGEGRPRPDLRVALVAYRDQGDAYVTRVFDLTGDMDAVYQELSSLRAEGGGDGPEHVSRALSDAVTRVSWSSGKALRLVFLVGDAPPHTDYQDGYDYRRHAGEARQRGIAVETIQCGADPRTQQFWQEIAHLGEGHYARIDAQGGMPAHVTPVDAELARLNAELAATVVAGGSAEEQATVVHRLDARARMAAPAAAEAAGYFASADRLAEKDLVDLPAAEQKKALAQPAQAPAALRGKSEAEALAYLKTQKEQRDRLQLRILELQKQREAFLARSAPAADGFDAQVLTAIRDRARRAGIAY